MSPRHSHVSDQKVFETGTKCVALHRRTLRWAVAELLKKGPATTQQLKVASGEHLAAILLTAFVLAAPSAVDTTGEVDLVFVVDTERSIPDRVAVGEVVAVEVKSVAGRFRKFNGWTDRAGSEALGAEVTVQVRSADTILSDAAPLINRMAMKLESVCANHRYGFMVVHPFEQFAAEIISEPVLAGVLQPLVLPQPLDGLWVLWWPDQVTAWSQTEHCWYQMFFDAVSSDDDTECSGPLDALRETEEAFLSGIGFTEGSPFLFDLRSKPDE
jgi:hypothetical protein